MARAAGLAFWEAEEARELAIIERAAGRHDLAEPHARYSLQRSREIRYRRGVLGALATLARIARSAGDLERAGLLWGALEAEERRAPAAWAIDREAWEAVVSADAGAEFERARRTAPC